MRITHYTIYLMAVLGFTTLTSCGEETQFAGSAAKQGSVDSEVPTDVGPGEGDLTKKTGELGEEPIAQGTNPDPTDEEGESPQIEIIVDSSKEEIPTLNIIREYVSGMTVPGKMEVDVMNDSIDQMYTLMRERITVKNTKDFDQIEKPPVAQKFQQGTAGAAQMDMFDQVQTGILDILIVVDDSGSMRQEQENLATKLDPLLASIGDSAWQIGIVTTDSSKPCLRALIKKGDQNIAAAFKTGIEAGLNGSGNERGILNAAIGLGFDVSGDGFTNCTTNWIRPKSTIAVLIVSDEDNCSNGDCGDNLAWEEPTYLTDKLAAIRTIKTDARVYGLFNVPDTTCDTAARVGNVYQSLVTLTGGLSGSICDADYSSTLLQISKDVASILKAQFELSMVPDAGSIKVYVNGTLMPSGYSISGTTVTFDVVPPKDAKIMVSYSVGATTIYTEFPLAERPSVNSMAVMINGVAANANTFTVDYDAKLLKFDAAPVDNAAIKAMYKKEMVLPKTYNIGMRANAASIKATVDAAAVTLLSYDNNTGIAELTVAPGEKAKVRITYDTPELGNPIIDFPFTTPWKTVKDLTARDADSGDNVVVNWAGDKLSFDPGGFIEGRKVIITYRDESEGPGRIVGLSALPKNGKVTVSGVDSDGGMIACEASDIVIDGKQVTTKCDLSEAMKIVYDFKYDIELKSEFVVDEVVNPDAARWSVWVNGVLTINFEREGNKIKFPEALAGGTVVKIEAKFDY